MALTTNVSELSAMPDTISSFLPRQSTTATKVYIRLVFLRIGEIDTLNEKYQAQASIEARWAVKLDKLASKLSADDQKQLINGKSVSLQKYAETNWHPQLYIENALGDVKEQIRYSARKSREDNEFYVCEYRDVKGLFWEKLELHHFPSDVQDLSISVASMLYDDKVLLTADPHHQSGVNREAFVDQQEWSLYQHVGTEERFVKEFLTQNFDKDDDDRVGESADQTADRKRSILTVTCHAARYSNYFYWNGFCLVLFITLVSFCIFSIPPHFTANRIQTSCTLLLTSITFRWTVNRSLPTISYLTLMDKYAIFCIINLIVLCFWHAAMGFLIFQFTPDFRVTRGMWLNDIDRYFFLGAVVVFLLLHLALLLWLYFVPLKYRREMEKEDLKYGQLLSKDKKTFRYIPVAV